MFNTGISSGMNIVYPKDFPVLFYEKFDQGIETTLKFMMTKEIFNSSHDEMRYKDYLKRKLFINERMTNKTFGNATSNLFNKGLNLNNVNNSPSPNFINSGVFSKIGSVKKETFNNLNISSSQNQNLINSSHSVGLINNNRNPLTDSLVNVVSSNNQNPIQNFTQQNNNSINNNTQNIFSKHSLLNFNSSINNNLINVISHQNEQKEEFVILNSELKFIQERLVAIYNSNYEGDLNIKISQLQFLTQLSDSITNRLKKIIIEYEIQLQKSKFQEVRCFCGNTKIFKEKLNKEGENFVCSEECFKSYQINNYIKLNKKIFY